MTSAGRLLSLLSSSRRHLAFRSGTCIAAIRDTTPRKIVAAMMTFEEWFSPMAIMKPSAATARTRVMTNLQSPLGGTISRVGSLSSDGSLGTEGRLAVTVAVSARETAFFVRTRAQVRLQRQTRTVGAQEPARLEVVGRDPLTVVTPVQRGLRMDVLLLRPLTKVAHER